jgi:hypothetical protein
MRVIIYKILINTVTDCFFEIRFKFLFPLVRLYVVLFATCVLLIIC